MDKKTPAENRRYNLSVSINPENAYQPGIYTYNNVSMEDVEIIMAQHKDHRIKSVSLEEIPSLWRVMVNGYTDTESDNFGVAVGQYYEAVYKNRLTSKSVEFKRVEQGSRQDRFL